MTNIGQSVGHVVIANRGRLCMFAGIDGLDPRALVGQQVIADGEVRTVDAVETYDVPDATGHSFAAILR